jgi:hypothetical protein
MATADTMEPIEPNSDSLPSGRRSFRYRLWAPLAILLVIGIGLSWYAVKLHNDRPALVTTADDVARYRGHRYRVWFFDRKTRAVTGFSDVMLRPGESIRLEPVAGVWMEVQLQSPMRQSVTDGYRIIEQYDAVGYALKHRGGGVDGAESIIWPDLRMEHRIAQGYDAVVFSLPVGPTAAEAMAGKIPKEFRGTADEIEEVLLACLPEYSRLFSEQSLAALYVVIGPARHPDRWRELMENPDLRIRSTLVLALAGDREATEILCQGDRLETLVLLPPSARVLERLVSIIVQEERLPCTPIPGIATYPDRRCLIVPEILRRYPRPDLLPYAPQLLRRAEDCDESWAGELRKYFGGRLNRNG